MAGILKPMVFQDLSEKIVTGFTTKEHGDMRINQDGAPNCETYKLLLDDIANGYLGGKEEKYDWALPGLVHGARVEMVESPGFYARTDGFVTRRRKTLLCMTAADCASILLADAEASVIGACHAGWRGALSGIVPNTLKKMKSEGAQATTIRAYVGPCLSADDFEVGEEVAESFPPAFVIRQAGWPRPHVDLKGFIHHQLCQEGVFNVESYPGSTLSEKSKFFSHRGDGGHTGRMMAFIALR